MLRKLVFVLILSMTIFVSQYTAYSQKTISPLYSNAISANPIGLVFGIFNATYEHQVSAQNTFTVSGYYWSILDWTAYGIGGSFRWYLQFFEDGKRPIEGFGFGPAIAIGFWDWGGYDPFDYYTAATSIAIGGEAAYKWVFGGFVIEPIIQLMFNVTTIYGSPYKAFGLGANIGYAW